MSREIRRTPENVEDWLMDGGWSVTSGSRGAPAEDPLAGVDLPALRAERRLGLSLREWDAIHRRGRPSRETADARRRFQEGIAAIQEAGGSLDLTARVLGISRDMVYAAAAAGRRAA